MRRFLPCVGTLLAALLSGCGFSIAHTGPQKDVRTPLEKAAQDGNLAEVQRLLDAGADPNDKSGYFGSPLIAAAFRRGNAETVRLLIKAGADPNGRRPESNRCWVSPLFHSAANDDVALTRMLLDAGASLTLLSPCSQSWNAGWFDPEILSLLVSRGLNLRAVDDDGRNQLHLALAAPAMPRPAAIEYLIRAGVPVNARDKHGRTPFAYWQEPRDFEVHWFSAWLLDQLGVNADGDQMRKTRERITASLKYAGAIT